MQLDFAPSDHMGLPPPIARGNDLRHTAYDRL